MKYATEYINWIDLETTGLDVETCTILEVALIVTDGNLVEKHRESLVVGHNLNRLSMTKWAWEQHSKTGLLEEIRTEYIGRGVGVFDLDELFFRIVRRGAPLGGSSPHFDRKFIERYMPHTAKELGHRNVDVSSMLTLAHSAGVDLPIPEAPHRAMPDIERSLEIARSFRERITQ